MIWIFPKGTDYSWNYNCLFISQLIYPLYAHKNLKKNRCIVFNFFNFVMAANTAPEFEAEGPKLLKDGL